LTSPADDAIDQPIVASFSWNSAATATSYRLQIAQDIDFSTIMFENSTADTFLIEGPLAYLTMYYWRVVSSNAGGPGLYSPSRKFTTIVESPVLDSPPNGSIDRELTLRLGWGTVFDATTYRLQVSEDSLFSVLVLDDSLLTRITRTVGPLARGTTFYWRVSAKRGSESLPFSQPWHFTTRSTASIPYAISSQWNLISMPVMVSDFRKDILFPTSVSPAYDYNGSYRAVDTLRVGTGYWLKFDAAQDLAIVGYPVEADTVQVDAGWNIIGSIASDVPVSSVVGLGTVIHSLFFGFNNQYEIADTIKRGRGYWVKVDSSGSLILSSSVSMPKFAVHFSGISPVESSRLVFQDALGHTRVLLFGKEISDEFAMERFELPPLPPRGTFDVRYGSGRMFETIEPLKSDEFPISVSAPSLPVTIAWEVHDGQDLTASLILGENEILLRGKGSTRGIDPGMRLKLRLSGEPDVPKEFALEQNYPNPFNPTTVIRYQLPVNSYVSLEVYNVLGQRMWTLIQEFQERGYKSVEWNAGGIASGVYFCRLDVTPRRNDASALPAGSNWGERFTQIRKMLLVK
jgi:hypothetical protein